METSMADTSTAKMSNNSNHHIYYSFSHNIFLNSHNTPQQWSPAFFVPGTSFKHENVSADQLEVSGFQ